MSRLMKMGFAQKATPLFINSELVNQIMHLYYSLHIFKIREHHGMSVYIYMKFPEPITRSGCTTNNLMYFFRYS